MFLLISTKSLLLISWQPDLRQSPNVILDLRRMDGRIPTKKLLDEVRRQLALNKSVKRIIVITRQEEHIDFER